MIDLLFSLLALCAVPLALYGCIRLDKRRQMRRTRQEQARQWAAHTRWISEQQQRRQHQRAVRNSNN